MSPRHFCSCAIASLLVLMAAAPASSQSVASAEYAPALLRQPWTRGSIRFERSWQFLGPLTAVEAAADPAALLKPDGAAAKRWVNQVGHGDAIDVAVDVPPSAATDVLALGRTTVQRDHDGEATLLIGAEGGLEVFVNGASVYRRPKPAPFAFDQDAVNVVLKQGENDIVLRLEHNAGPWQVALRAVEPGTVVAPVQEIDPSLIASGPDVLSVQTHRESAPDRAPVEVEIVAPGGTILAHRNGKRGEILPFATTMWPDGPYEIRCSTENGWGQRRFVYLPWYKGDPLPAVRELVALAARQPAGPVGDTLRMLAEMVRDHLRGNLDSTGPDTWRAVQSPLMEYRELLLARAGKTGGIRGSGFFRLAYTDEVDGSTQFCRAYLPPDYTPNKRWPLVAYLHGFNPPNPPYVDWWAADARHSAEADNFEAIVIEPHGRGNTQYRGIGESDVLHAIAEAKSVFTVDDDRVYLTGESMGGFGTWSVGTRHPDLFAAIAPVHGGWDFRLTPASAGGLVGRVPTNDPQRWMLELQSGFVSAENLRNVPVFINHGDADQSVSVENSRFAVHLLERWNYDIGYDEHVGYGHEDHYARSPNVAWLLTHRRADAPKAVRLRAADLGAASAYWLRVDASEQSARLINVDAEFLRPGFLRLDTDNVAALTLTPPESLAPPGGELTVVWNGKPSTFDLKRRASNVITLGVVPAGLAKHRGLEGTISDVITTPFIVVVGTISPDAAMREMCRQKSEAFAASWLGWQKHLPRVRTDRELTDEEKRNFSLILVGGPDANSVARELTAKLPFSIDATGVTIEGRSWPVSDAVAQMIYPSPLAAEKYVLVVAGTSATGLYFWAPRLTDFPYGYPSILWDWTIQDGRRVSLPAELPSEDSYVAAGIFDRSWHREDRTTMPGNAELRAASPLRRGPLAAEAAAKVVIQRFVGQYEVSPGVALRVSTQNGQLILSPPGSPDLPLIPESDTEFGVMSVGGSFRFVVDPDQQVSALIANLDGHDTTYKRLPAQP